MKRIVSLFLTTILCASGVLTLQGMHPMQPDGSDNDKKPKPLFNFTGEIDVDKSPEGLKRWQDILSNAQKAATVAQSALAVSASPSSPSSTDEKIREEETVQAAVPARPVAAIQKPTIVVEQGTLPGLALQHSDEKIQTEPTAHDPRLGEVADRSLVRDDQWQNVFDNSVAIATAAMQQNPSMQAEIKTQADSKPVQKKKVRSLIYLLPQKLAIIPAAVWINHIVPFSDYASSIFPIQLTPMNGSSDNLKSPESWHDQHAFCESTAEATSSDGQLYALTTINKIPEHVFMVGLQLKGFTLETIIIDLKTRKRIGRFKTEIEAPPGLWYRYTTTSAQANTSFERGSTVLHISGDFTVEGANIDTPHINLLFDLTEFKFNKKFQEAWANTLTPQQSILLMLLDGLQKKNNNKPISLLHDIALREMLSLKELQDTLASFHPIIIQTLIKRYAIIDPTPQASREVALKVKAAHALKLTQSAENKSYWMNVAKKITGATAVVATIGALRWYLKKK